MDFTHEVDQALVDFAERKRQELSELGAEMGRFTALAQDFVRGGKHIRPAFCRAGWLAAGGAVDEPRLVYAASALEWLQASALVHDDLMDSSDTRRGKPSAHKRFEAIHAAHGWSSDARSFSTSAALLLGDLMLMWCDEMFHQSGFAAQDVLRAVHYLDLAKTEVTAGQYLDVLGQYRGHNNLESAMDVVRFKSAKYTVERPLHIGAALVSSDDHLIAQLSQVGLPLGEAFQLRDDLLGIFGDPDRTGKPAGDDLREGKQTVLIALAMLMGSAADQDAISIVLGNPESTGEQISRAQQALATSGAVAKTESMIDSLVDQAMSALDSLETEEARAELERLALAVTRRES